VTTIAYGDRVVVWAPGDFANSQLNGSEGLVVAGVGGRQDAVVVLLLAGPEASKEWHIRTDHLRKAGTEVPS